MAIVDSKFLEYAVNVLSVKINQFFVFFNNFLQEEEKIFEIVDFNAQRTFTKLETMNIAIERKGTKQLTDSAIDLSASPKGGLITGASLKNPQNKLNIHPGRLARIKMKVI